MRLKIIAGNLAVVVLLGLAAYLSVSGELSAELLKRLDAEIANDRELFDRSFRLSAIEFVDLVSQRAAERQLRGVFAGLDVDSRRTRAFEAAETTASWLSDPARGNRGGPDIVVVVDETGKALARNGARNVMFGKALAQEIPAVAAVLKGGPPQHDVWLEDRENKALEIAVAPIHGDTGNVLGALLVGYDLSNGLARREGEVLGRDIAFLVEGKVYSSSLGGGPAKDLKDFLFGPQANATNAILGGQAAAGQVWLARLEGAEYRGLTSGLPMAPSAAVAFVVLGSRTAQTQMLSALNVILILTILGAILVGFYGFVIGNTVMRPIEEIEEGILAVINGRTDLRLETKSAEFGGLAFRINQLLNVFTGTEEQSEDEEGRVSVAPSAGNWKDAAFGEGGGGGGAASGVNPDEPIDDPGLSAKLAAEDEGAYSTRLYKEYVAAKEALGEAAGNIPLERFSQRLQGRASALAQKHGCRLVRFQVETQGNQVVLRPVLIR